MSDADRTKWNDRYSRRATRLPLDEPAEFLVSLVDQLPATGRALDVAGGTGRNAIWLAQRGLDVTLPSGEDGVWLEFCKGSKSHGWVLKGGRDGPKIVVPVDGLITRTFMP